jgi:hypothetical protein
VDDGALQAVEGVQTVERKDRSVTVTGTGDLAASLINALAAHGVQVSELEARHGNLDDAFIKLTRDTASEESPWGTAAAAPDLDTTTAASVTDTAAAAPEPRAASTESEEVQA